MDKRIALDKGYVLEFKDDSFIIDGEIGRGGSCIVYDAHYYDNLHLKQRVRIKECYPVGVAINRLNNGLIQVEDDEEAFALAKKALHESYLVNTKLLYEDTVGTEIINVKNIYELNNTVYIVYPYINAKELDINQIVDLKELLFIVRSVAQIISVIHKNGFLYLDLKPSNILVFEGINKGIQLFDFDTLLPMEHKDIATYRLSFSKGFSSLEQCKGDLANIGIWSDVYSVGALLYYMVFGKKPGVVCGDEHELSDYTEAKYDFDEYPEELVNRLSAFWRMTLPSYYPDRYSDMTEVVESLEQMEKLANRDLPFIISAKLLDDNWFIGRSDELEQLEKWFLSNSPTCYVYGLPGMGKSTLVKEFLDISRSRYDYLMYAYYSESIKKTIVSDDQIRIYGIHKTTEENDEDYFERKLRIISRICKESNVILVIDEYDGEMDRDFHRLIDSGMRIIVISDRILLTDYTYNIAVQRLNDAESLKLFEHHLYRQITGDEIANVNDIISFVDGHVYAIESCAKQIRYSSLTVDKACELVNSQGFTKIADEKIPFYKDNIETKQTIKGFFEELFAVDTQSGSMRMMLRIISMFGNDGIGRDTLKDYLFIKNWDELNELIEKGWINEENHRLRVHSIINEIIKGWNWNEYEINEMNRIFSVAYRVLVIITESDNMSKDKVEFIEKVRKMPAEKILADLGKRDKVFALEMRDKIMIPIDDQKVSAAEKLSCLFCDLKLLYGVMNAHELTNNEWFVRLAGKVADDLPREYVDISLDLYERISQIVRPTRKGELKIGETKLQRYLDYGDLEKAEALVKELQPQKSDLRRMNMSYYNALYYDTICAPFYDYRLNGQYFEDNEYHDYGNLVASNDKALFYYTLEYLMRRNYSFVKCYVARAQFLLRAYDGEKQERIKIEKAIKKAERMVEKYCQDSSLDKYRLLLAKAWYSTYVKPDENIVFEIEKQVRNIATKITVSKLDYIDECLIPFANMYYELNDCDMSCDILNEAINICASFPDFVPYQKKNEELLHHLQEMLG